MILIPSHLIFIKIEKPWTSIFVAADYYCIHSIFKTWLMSVYYTFFMQITFCKFMFWILPTIMSCSCNGKMFYFSICLICFVLIRWCKCNNNAFKLLQGWTNQTHVHYIGSINGRIIHHDLGCFQSRNRVYSSWGI